MAIPEFLRQLVSQADVTWSIATFGAIAEFSYTSTERTDVHVGEKSVTIVSPRGALRFRIPSKALTVAYEGLSKNPRLWSQGISVCLPEADALLSNETCLEELGHDGDAIREQNQGDVLFDIGLGAPHMQACIRTSDRGLISLLREYSGTSLFGDDATVLHGILHKSPDRVFHSRLGRIEVTTPIAHEDGETALGPHTHVLPELLAHGRTHAASVPIPEGFLPCLNVFPPNPARDDRGNARPFDSEAHALFQHILADHGDETGNQVKEQVNRCLAAGEAPSVMESNLSRIERTALRVALRQHYHTHGDSDMLSAWREVYEPNDGDRNQPG